MNMHEYNERVSERNRVTGKFQNPKWEAITTAYLALDMHRDNFCKMVGGGNKPPGCERKLL